MKNVLNSKLGHKILYTILMNVGLTGCNSRTLSTSTDGALEYGDIETGNPADNLPINDSGTSSSTSSMASVSNNTTGGDNDDNDFNDDDDSNEDDGDDYTPPETLPREVVYRPGDLNGDGKADLILQSKFWRASVWNVNATTATVCRFQSTESAGSVTVNPVEYSYQRIVGTTDQDLDGRADILLQHEDGSVSVMYVQGAKSGRRVTIASAQASPGLLDWRLVGSCDINRDGKQDFLWQHRATGDAGLWYMNGETITAAQVFGSSIDYPGIDQWRLIGCYKSPYGVPPNGSTVLWQAKVNGTIATWDLDQRGVFKSVRALANYSNRLLVTALDVTGEGIDDLIFRNIHGDIDIKLQKQPIMNFSAGYDVLDILSLPSTAFDLILANWYVAGSMYWDEMPRPTLEVMSMNVNPS